MLLSSLERVLWQLYKACLTVMDSKNLSRVETFRRSINHTHGYEGPAHIFFYDHFFGEFIMQDVP